MWESLSIMLIVWLVIRLISKPEEKSEDKVAKEEERIYERAGIKYFTPRFFWFLTKSKTKILFEPKSLVKPYSDAITFYCHSFVFNKYNPNEYHDFAREINCAAALPAPLIRIREYPSEYRRLSAKKQRDIRFLTEIKNIEIYIYKESTTDNRESSLFYKDGLKFHLYLPFDEFEEYWQLKSCEQLLFNLEVNLPLYREPGESEFEHREYLDAVGVIDDKNILKKRTGEDGNTSSALNVDFSSLNISYQIFHKPESLSQELRELQVKKHRNRDFWGYRQ